jgi:hypothetical protein
MWKSSLAIEDYVKQSLLLSEGRVAELEAKPAGPMTSARRRDEITAEEARMWGSFSPAKNATRNGSPFLGTCMHASPVNPRITQLIAGEKRNMRR